MATYDYELMRRIAVDPRIVADIQSNAGMYAEQGAGFLSSWGGPATYRALVKLPVNQRLTYAAVLEGNASAEDISAVTDLPIRDVEAALDALGRKGLVDTGEEAA